MLFTRMWQILAAVVLLAFNLTYSFAQTLNPGDRELQRQQQRQEATESQLQPPKPDVRLLPKQNLPSRKPAAKRSVLI